MPQDVFDDTQLTSMTAAIDLIVSEAGSIGAVQSHNVAHAVFSIASEFSAFDAAALAESARQALSPGERFGSIACARQCEAAK